MQIEKDHKPRGLKKLKEGRKKDSDNKFVKSIYLFRYYMILPLHSAMSDVSCIKEFQSPYAEAVLNLQGNANKVKPQLETYFKATESWPNNI